MENVYSTLCFAMNDPLLPWSCSTLFAKKSPEGSLGIHIAAKRIELSSYELFFLVNNIFCLFVCNKGDTILYQGGHPSRELGQVSILQVFLIPRQGLSSHPHQQMVCLYWLQVRDSMPNWCTITHPTTLQTHNETQRPTAACQWHFALRDVFCRQTCHLSTTQKYSRLR